MEQKVVPDNITLIFCNTSVHNPYRNLQDWSDDVHKKLIEQEIGIGLNEHIGARRARLSTTEKTGQLPYKGSIYTYAPLRVP